MWIYSVALYWMIGELFGFASYIHACRSANTTSHAAYGIAYLCSGVLLAEVGRVALVLAGVFAPVEKAYWLWLLEHAPFALFWYDIGKRHVANITRTLDRD